MKHTFCIKRKINVNSFIRSYQCCLKITNKRDDTYDLYKKENKVSILKTKNKRGDTYVLFKKENKMSIHSFVLINIV